MERVMLPSSMMAALRRADRSVNQMGLGRQHPLREALRNCQSLPGAISLAPFRHEVPDPVVFEVHTDENGAVGEDTKCPICLDDFSEDNNKILIKTRCGHTFHATCLHAWKTTQINTAYRASEIPSVTCPSCRTVL